MRLTGSSQIEAFFSLDRCCHDLRPMSTSLTLSLALWLPLSLQSSNTFLNLPNYPFSKILVWQTIGKLIHGLTFPESNFCSKIVLSLCRAANEMTVKILKPFELSCEWVNKFLIQFICHEIMNNHCVRKYLHIGTCFSSVSD